MEIVKDVTYQYWVKIYGKEDAKMKIQFCNIGNFLNTIAEFDVAQIPTEEQCNAIEDYIFAVMDNWEEEYGDFSEFDYWKVCYDAVVKNLEIVENPVIKTFYV